MSTRIIVKNIPKHLTVERFRKHFEERGEVTDAKIMTTRSGKARLFGFIGYKSPEQAKEAVQYFDKTYLDTSRIVVEMAKSVGDPHLGRPWSSHSQGSSAFLRKTKEKEELQDKKRKRLDGVVSDQIHAPTDKKGNKDQKLTEFLEAMKPKSATKLWSNDDALTTIIEKEIGQQTKKQKVEAKVAQVENKRPGGKGIMLKKVHVKFDDDEDQAEASDNDYEELPDAKEDENMQTEDKIVNDDAVSDLDYIKSRMVKNLDELDKEEDIEELAKQDELEQKQESKKKKENSKEKKATEKSEKKVDTKNDTKKDETKQPEKEKKAEDPEDDIGKTGRIFVRNLSFMTSEEELIEKFQRFGTIAEVHIPINRETKQGKGIAFIQYLNPPDALKAMNELDGKIFQGRLLHIIPAKTLHFKKENISATGKTYKAQKEQEKKAGATNEQHSWNSLFMGSDAVAESIAHRLGVSKSDVLDREASNLAVRLALAETQIINETKKFFEEQGVSLDNLGSVGLQNIKRSSTIILVKNIPYSTTEDELTRLFERFGGLARVVLPPARTIALVEFHEPNEAKSAFRGLAYRQFNGVPMYLEWAPVEVFTGKPKPKEKKQEEEEEKVSKDDVVGDEDEKTATLYVKNLNFETSEDSLRDMFTKIGALRHCSVAKKKDPKNPGKMLSRGFGFVEFYSRDDAVKALKTLQGKILDGHAIDMKFSGKMATTDSAAKRKTVKQQPTSNKLIVRNLPFEASKQELKELFKPFGQIKRVTIPKKVSNNYTSAGQSRGFAFVEYISKQDALRAMEALQSTHLYGRHLVLEFAKDEKPKTTTDDILSMFE